MSNYPNNRIRQGTARLSPLFLILIIPVVLSAALPTLSIAADRPQADRNSAGLQPAGNVERGRQLFMGEVHLQNGGPPCMGCHNIDSNGLLGGGVVGPDLTEVSSRYTNAALAQALANIPWPTMKLIFTDHPLLPQEQADLQAFLEASAGQPRTNRELWLLGLSLAGFAAVTGVFGFLYRRRLRAIRKPLVEKSQANPKA